MNEHVVLDIKTIQKDRAATMPGYRLVTFDEMEVDPPAKQWLIKGILARGETSAWIAPPGAMKSALLAEGCNLRRRRPRLARLQEQGRCRGCLFRDRAGGPR